MYSYRTAPEWRCGRRGGLCCATCVFSTIKVSYLSFLLSIHPSDSRIQTRLWKGSSDLLGAQRLKHRDSVCRFPSVYSHGNSYSVLNFSLPRRKGGRNPWEHTFTQLPHLPVVCGWPHKQEIRFQGHSLFFYTLLNVNLSFYVTCILIFSLFDNSPVFCLHLNRPRTQTCGHTTSALTRPKKWSPGWK